MKLSVIDKLESVINSCDDSIRFRRDYSGRAMYGRETGAVVASSKDTVMLAVLDEYENGYLSKEDMLEIMRALGDANTDNMGRDDIVIY